MSISVKTVADPRVVTESGVEFNQYVGPLNWEHYKIPASGLSNTQITFANLVTLGTNRIYDSAFQIEYTVDIDFGNNISQLDPTSVRANMRFHPFPLHWVTDQLRTNINGAACMVRPQENLPQRMMYWRQRILDRSCNYCPHTKAPSIQDVPINQSGTTNRQDLLNFQMRYGKNGSQNVGTFLPCIDFRFENTVVDPAASAKTYRRIAHITFREPVLCPPFNQRLDKLYQSPLFNITSIDLVYQLNDLRVMLEEANLCVAGNNNAYSQQMTPGMGPSLIQSINISSAQLCFNVASLPTGMTVPPVLDMPYYDNVCYVTSANTTAVSTGEQVMTSGVYTLAQVPTAIYIFVAPNQLYRSSECITQGKEPGFCPIRDINITMGNNTQLLNTTTEYDRYQMALANGLEDVTWEEFSQPCIPLPHTSANVYDYEQGQRGCKCILRLIPGVDLLIPDKRLVGGTDAEQMVFQVRLTANVDGIPAAMRPFLSLWIMFEYCGILSIAPVHANIDMLPLKTVPPIGDVQVPNDVTIDQISGGGEGTNPRGAGLFDILRSGYKLAKRAWNSNIGKRLRGIADDVLDGEPSAKITKGGAIIGGGDFYS